MRKISPVPEINEQTNDYLDNHTVKYSTNTPTSSGGERRNFGHICAREMCGRNVLICEVGRISVCLGISVSTVWQEKNMIKSDLYRLTGVRSQYLVPSRHIHFGGFSLWRLGVEAQLTLISGTPNPPDSALVNTS